MMKSRSFVKEEDFEAYLETTPVGPEECSDDNSMEECEEQQVTVRPSWNEERKRSEKHEDTEWVEQQRRFLEERENGVNNELPDDLLEFQTDEDAQTALRRLQTSASSTKGLSLLCMSRIWAGGWGGQCTSMRQEGSDYCKHHSRQIKTQGYLTHGRWDGPIPPKKRKEFQTWQAKLCAQQGLKATADLTVDDSTFKESLWRNMERGAGESRRAYALRTGKELPPQPSEETQDATTATPKKAKKEPLQRRPKRVKRTVGEAVS